MNTFFEKDWISRNQFLYKDAISNVELWIKREDEIHPIISGNKFRKLKYNLTTAKKEGKTKLLTFGGAYSNHISAVAEAAHLVGLEVSVSFVEMS
jgi:1-aminocyclopropane-1-carboxylate deaminase